MEIETMGRVTVMATFDNLGDLWSVKYGLIPAVQARRIVVPDGLFDEDEALTWMATHLIERLGLMIQGRDFTMGVAEAGDVEPVRIGRIVLLSLDLVIDHESRTLVGNPAHGGEWMYESYRYSTTESTA